MSRRSSRSLAGSPLLIGAVTTLVVIVAVFLSYNANNGLPFVPTYDINVTLPDATSLQIGNDVRIGGTRVGSVAKEKAQQNLHTGAVSAVVGLKLEKRLQELPIDTTVVVRDRSSLGEKYLELTPGTSTRKLPPGGTLPLSAATPAPVEIDQVLNMFNAPTRTAIQTNTVFYGNGFAGRGANLNSTISNLDPALANLEPLARTLGARDTHLAGLFAALERASAQVAPVAVQQGEAFIALDTTFKALAGVAPSIGQATDDGPASLDQATFSLVYERPFIAQLTRFFALLAPGAVALRQAAPSLAPAVEAGVKNLPGAAATNQQLSTTLAALQAFAEDPRVLPGLLDLRVAFEGGNPIVADLAGMQTQCNYPTLFFRNLASDLAEGTSVGNWLRALPIFPYSTFDPKAPFGQSGDPQNAVIGPNSEGGPASAPANGGNVGSTPARVTVSQNNHLHATPYPYVGAVGQPAGVCEPGNQTYTTGQTVIGHAHPINNNRDFSTSDG